MKERRRYPRFAVEIMDLNGKILFANEVKILDLSVGGVLIKADKRLNIGRNYVLRIESRGKKLNVQGTVVRCMLSESQKVQGNIIPIYTAGMQFTNLTSEKMNEIADFIRQNVQLEKYKACEPDILKVSGIRLHVRFRIENLEKASVEFFEVYKVKKISLCGMLIESEEQVKAGDKLSMEMELFEDKTIRFLGKIINCEPLKDTFPMMYKIGIEFDEMPEEDKITLKRFIDSLSQT